MGIYALDKQMLRACTSNPRGAERFASTCWTNRWASPREGGDAVSRSAVSTMLDPLTLRMSGHTKTPSVRTETIRRYPPGISLTEHSHQHPASRAHFQAVLYIPSTGTRILPASPREAIYNRVAWSDHDNKCCCERQA
jgi:hypothetical protein